MEVDFVDVKASSHTEIIYYEVKPYQSATKCIREGLGQLLLYVARDSHNKKKKLVVVGPRPLIEEDLIYYNLIRELFSSEELNLDFEYTTFSLD